jgi:glycosyltransferase involved in cell wall biosynthesis
MKISDRQLKVRIIVPCHNEEENIELLLLRLVPVVSPYDYSILFIDDGSTDNTLEKLQIFSGHDPRLLYISLSRNFGQQNALKAGYDRSLDADIVISMDGDLQHPPEAIPEMVRMWKQGFEIVNTVRKSNYRMSVFKRNAAKLFYLLVNFISKDKILENGPDYRLLDRKVVHAIQSINESNLYWKELIPWIGFKQGEIGFDVEKRMTGTSKYSLYKSIALSVRGITSFSINPLRLSSLLGGIFSLLSFLYGLYAGYIYFFTDKAVQGWTSLIGSILLISGIQFILIGIIGEYLGKTFLETKKRPLYIVSRECPLTHMEKEELQWENHESSSTDYKNERIIQPRNENHLEY